jgi:hypothetical protein
MFTLKKIFQHLPFYVENTIILIDWAIDGNIHKSADYLLPCPN